MFPPVPLYKEGDLIWFTLDSPNNISKAWSYNDIITGKVYVGAKLWPFEFVDVHLRCESTSFVNVSGHRKEISTSRLVSLVERVYARKVTRTTSSNLLSWPFVFQFPFAASSGNPDTSDCVFEPNTHSITPYFEDEKGFSLPPSFYRIDNAIVEWYLEAIVPGNSFDPSVKHERRPLLFSPIRAELAPDLKILQLAPVPYNRRSRAFRSVQEQNHPGSGHRFALVRSMKPLNAEPEAYFDIGCIIARQVCAAGELPLTLTLKYDEKRSTAQAQPPIFLEKLDLSFKQQTSSRVPYRRGKDLQIFRTPKLCVEATEESWPMILGGRGTFLYDGMDVTEHFGAIKVPEFLPTSFRTFNIAVTYTLSVTATVNCGNKTDRLNICPERNIVILPSAYRPQLGEDIDLGPKPSQGSNSSLPLPPPAVENDDLPPPYEEIEGSRSKP